MTTKRLVFSLLFMFFISWCSFKGYDIKFFQSLKPIIKHSINFALLISVGAVGYYAIIAYPEKWLASIWLATYLCLIVLLVLIGLFDLIHPITSYLIRDSIAPARMFFTSPLPFLIMLFLRRSVVKKSP